MCWGDKGIVDSFSKGKSRPRSLKDEWIQKTSPFPGFSESVFASKGVTGKLVNSGPGELESTRPGVFCSPGE